MFHCVVPLVVQIRDEAGGAAGRNFVAPEIASEHAHTLGLQLPPALDSHFEELQAGLFLLSHDQSAG
jgi:hypothetical protein